MCVVSYYNGFAIKKVKNYSPSFDYDDVVEWFSDCLKLCQDRDENFRDILKYSHHTEYIMPLSVVENKYINDILVIYLELLRENLDELFVLDFPTIHLIGFICSEKFINYKSGIDTEQLSCIRSMFREVFENPEELQTISDTMLTTLMKNLDLE